MSANSAWAAVSDIGSKSSEGTLTSKAFAIVIPFYRGHVSLIKQDLAEWNTDDYWPCRKGERYGPETDLIFHYLETLADEPEIEREIRNALQEENSTSAIPMCFRNVYFHSAGLHNETAKYPRGVTIRFYTLSQNVWLAEQYSYYFLMDSDVLPIRRDWLDEIRRLAFMSDPFWAMGTLDRASHTMPYWWLTLNGNAIFSTDKAFRDYVMTVYRHYTGGYTFDVALIHYLKDQNWPLMQEVFPNFVYHDFIQHYSKIPWSLKLMRDRFPRTYFVHGDVRYS